MSDEVLIVSDAEVATLLTRGTCREVMAASLRDHAAGRTTAPSKVQFTFAPGPLMLGPAYLADRDVLGFKMATIRPANRAAGLPASYQYVPLFEGGTGRLLAVIGAFTATVLRTAAVSAVASQALARPDSRTLAIVGPGVQGREHVHALAEVFPLEAIHVAGGGPSSAARLAALLERDFPGRVKPTSVEEAVRAADMVVTATRATAPVVQRAWVRPGTHINAVGADTPEKQELDPMIVRDGHVIVDSLEQCLARGEIRSAIARGLLPPEQVGGELGQVLVGRVPGRTAPEQITVFDSTGIYYEDVALALWVYEEARTRGVGTPVAL